MTLSYYVALAQALTLSPLLAQQPNQEEQVEQDFHADHKLIATFRKKLAEAISEQDQDKLSLLFDFESLLDKSLAGIEPTTQENRDLIRGAKDSLEELKKYSL